MKKLAIFCMTAGLLLGAMAPVEASITYDSTPLWIGQVCDNWWGGDPIDYEWDHLPSDNPYPGDIAAYDAAVAAGQIESVTTTLVTDDLDAGSVSPFTFIDRYGVEHDTDRYGNAMYLETMTTSDEYGMQVGPGNDYANHITTTIFDLDPAWIDHTTCTGRLNYWWDGGYSQMEVETSMLSVTVVPEPATLALLAIGGLLLRRKK